LGIPSLSGQKKKIGNEGKDEKEETEREYTLMKEPRRLWGAGHDPQDGHIGYPPHPNIPPNPYLSYLV
jgi:hypothetical protein